MEKITLREITNDNFGLIIRLSESLSTYQKSCVAPNVISLAQAYVNYDCAWPRAIYLNEEPNGFVMIKTIDDDIPSADQPGYFLWRFMIAFDHQNKGYGKTVLDLIVDKCKIEGIKTLYTSCHFEGEQPLKFYLKYGFIDTGIVDDDEKVLKYTI